VASKRNPYRLRQENIERIGFPDYETYLASEYWATIRARVLRDSNHKCRCCGLRAWQVHHSDYEYTTMTGDDTQPLYAVCGDCHNEAESRSKDNRLQHANTHIDPVMEISRGNVAQGPINKPDSQRLSKYKRQDKKSRRRATAIESINLFLKESDSKSRLKSEKENEMFRSELSRIRKLKKSRQNRSDAGS